MRLSGAESVQSEDEMVLPRLGRNMRADAGVWRFGAVKGFRSCQELGLGGCRVAGLGTRNSRRRMPLVALQFGKLREAVGSVGRLLPSP